MSYQVLFALSSGLMKPLHVTNGKLERIFKHQDWIEGELEVELDEWKGETRWARSPAGDHLDDETFCTIASGHNRWVLKLYNDMVVWSEHPVEGGDVITLEDAKRFWRCLRRIDIPMARWTEDHYRREMKVMYEVLRGRPTDGIIPGGTPLTIEQATNVIILFSFIDPGDQRLDVCEGHDELSHTDEYCWCEKCGAIHEDEVEHRMKTCKHEGDECPLRRDYAEQFFGWDEED